MASLYKKPIVRTDPKTGKKTKTKSKKWWGRYRDVLGRDRRVPLASDKAAAQAMLHEHVRKAELEAAGLTNVFDDHARRPIAYHIDAFEGHLSSKGNSKQYVQEVTQKVWRIMDGCKAKQIKDVVASRVQQYLADLRDSGLSTQTSNHYLKAIKQFSRWLVRDRRILDDPLSHLSMLNVKTDRRHDRRALSLDAFACLIEAASTGPNVETISGPDRAMMYVLSAWTGYRKREIGSLTKRSLRLKEDPPTATVAAAYSKRKNDEKQVLHPEVVRRLDEWLLTKRSLEQDDLLFPVSGKVPGGTERKTAKMMRRDLKSAKSKWIEESQTDFEKADREQSDFLEYRDNDGLFADFHSNRHTFITSLERARISPRMAQSLARHSDIRLTLGTYTHIELHDHQAAIESLPAPPPLPGDDSSHASELQATGTDASPRKQPVVPTMVPRGASNGAIRLASDEIQLAPICTDSDEAAGQEVKNADSDNSRPDGQLCTDSHQSTSLCIGKDDAEKEVHPRGLEPLTFGSVDRCAIQRSDHRHDGKGDKKMKKKVNVAGDLADRGDETRN